MGGSYYANENGELKIELNSENGSGEIHLTGLEPNEEIYQEIIKGRCR